MGSSAGTLGLGLVAGVAIGLGAGFMLFGSAATPGGLDDAGGLGGPGGERAAAAVATADPLQPTAAEPERAPVKAPQGGFDSFASAVEAVKQEARRSGEVTVERGDGVVTGKVMTDDGTPLSGVLIRAVRQRNNNSDHPSWRPGDPAPPFDDLDRRVRERVAEREQHIADTVETTTDETGAYRLTGLVKEKWYRLSGYSAGYEIRSVSSRGRWGRRNRNRGHTVQAGGTLDLLAMPITVVKVTLEMPDGSTPSKATLAVSGTHSSSQSWVPRDPTLRLPPGSYKVKATVAPDPDRAQDPSAQTFESQPAELEIAAGTPDAALTLAMKSQPGLAGRVSGFGDDLNAYIRVNLLKLEPGVKATKEAVAASSKTSWARGNNPIYRFPKLEPGRYLVGAGHQHGTIEVMQEVDVGEGLTVVDLAVPEPEAGDTLIVRAIGPNGRPVGDINFWLTRTNGNNASPRRRSRTEDGGHRLDFPPHTFKPKPDAKPDPGAQPPGPWILTARSPLYGQTTVELGPDQRDVTIQWAAPAKLIITFPGYAASDLKGHVTVAVTEPKDGSNGEESVHHVNEWGGLSSRSRWGGRQQGSALDDTGVYTQGPLEPGPRVVTVYVASSENRWEGAGSLPAYKQTITLVSGDNNLTLRLPVVHELNVQVGKPEEDNPATLQIVPVKDKGGDADAEEMMWWGGNGVQAGPDGSVTFERLPPGRYRLYRHHKGVQEQMHVQVPAQERIRFIPEANDAMQVWIQDETGMLAKAGLQQGDTVIEVDGAPFADAAAFAAALRAGGAELTLGYRRKGKRGTATLNRDALTAGMISGQGLGGGLSPTSSGR